MPRSFVSRALSALPRGRWLPDAAFAARHRALLAVLWLHVPVLFAVALAAGSPLGHALLHPLPVVALAGLAWRLGDRRERSLAAAFGLLTCSALLVHTLDGLIEAHFHFFVVLTVLAVYEDWRVYGVALGYVLVHHGLVGVGLPYRVFDHAGADTPAEAWRWAAVHGLFFTLAVAASTVLWSLNERARDAALSELRGRVHAEGVAEALARGLRPDALPRMDGVELAARYEPGGGRVGGDWYDVIGLPDGRLLVALGDAAGHGPDAAGLSARLRHVWRAYAEDGMGPAAVLSRLDRSVGDSLATAVCLMVDCERSEVTYSVAGHLPPLLRGPGGDVRALAGARAMPLVGLGAAREEVVEPIVPGSTLVLFSDGLVERRGESLDRGIWRLGAAVETIGGDPGDLAGALIGRVAPAVGAAEDVSLLVIRCGEHAHRRAPVAVRAA